MSNNNEIIEYKESFIFKIRKFFRKLFGIKEESENIQNEPLYNIEETKHTEPMSDIKVDSSIVNSVIEKKNFLDEIDRNEEALNMLSIERLQKLEKYYDSVIEKNNEIIKKLKEAV